MGIEAIRSNIEQYMEEHNINLYGLSKLSKVNRGVFSMLLNSNPPKLCSVRQLDRITEVIGLEEGELYLFYAEKCVEEKAHFRRIKPLLIRSAELNKLGHLRKIISLLSENTKKIKVIFATAEELFDIQLFEAAEILYDSIILTEKSRQSSNLAMSYYRLFKIHYENPIKGFELAIQFIPYRNYLPEQYMLDGLIMLIDTYVIREDWESVEQYADELRKLAKGIYRTKSWKNENFKPLRPLVYYYAQGHLYKSIIYEKLQMYDDFRKWTDGYADLSWFEGLDEAGKRDVENFKIFAQGNYLLCDIKSGNQNVIKDYVEFISAHPSEILEGLITIIESANKYGFCIDRELEQFSTHIVQFEENSIKPINEEIKYKIIFQRFRYFLFFQKYAFYCFHHQKKSEGNKNLLTSLKILSTFSDNKNLENNIVSMIKNYLM